MDKNSDQAVIDILTVLIYLKIGILLLSLIVRG